MKNKQIAGLLIAGCIFIAAGISSVLVNRIADAVFGPSPIGVLSYMMDTSYSSYDLPYENFIGIVRVQGTIQDVGSSGVFQTVSYDHQNTIRYIDDMIASEYNQGILLCVNSPGGTVYHSDELYLKLEEYKNATGRPVWAYMESQACSGGYYISMAADRIGANRNAWTGSIGVIISYMNYTGLYEKLGIEEIDIVSGANKAMGSAGKPLSREQEEIMQSLVDESYNQFVEIVAQGRDMSREEVVPLADGRLYTAEQARESGLIDEVNTFEEFETALREEVGGDSILYEPSFTNDNMFTSLLSAWKGSASKTEAQLFKEFLEKNGNGVPLYYAGNK